MKKPFGKKDEDVDDGIIVLKSTGRLECGGTDATRDIRAPKTIVSGNMTFFSVTSAFGPYGAFDRDEDGGAPLSYLSAFAAPSGQGTFLFLAAARCEEERKAWAYVKESPFPLLTRLVREHDLAKDNGYHSMTHGLPQNFGGVVDIRYASGERISFSDNQTPVLSLPTAREILDLFTNAMNGERLTLPDVNALKSIRFEERRRGGGFTVATLTLLPDGSGSNEKKSRYDDPLIYESTKPVDKETVDAIKRNIEDTGLFAWADLPPSDFKSDGERSLTFTFSDGAAVNVPDGRMLPEGLRRGFFNIQLELETKH